MGSRRWLEPRGGAARPCKTPSKELDAGIEVTERVRRPGAGRKPLEETDPDLVVALDDLVEPTARGSPMSPLRWTARACAPWPTNSLARDIR